MSVPGDGDQVIDLRLVRSALRRHRLLLLVATMLGTAAGVVLALLTPPMYTGTSLVIFDSPSVPMLSGAGQLALDVGTHAEIARSDAVLELAIDNIDADVTVDQLRDRVQTTTPTNSLLRIDVSDPEASAAIALAEAVSRAHVEFVAAATAPVLDESQAQLEGRIDEMRALAAELEGELDEARTRQDQAGAPASEAELIGQLTARRAEVAVELSSLQDQLDAAVNRSPALSGIDARVVPDAGSATRRSVVVRAGLAGLAGGLVGLLIGGLVAVNAARRDRTIWSAELLARVLGSPVVAGIGSEPRRSPAGWRRLLNDYDPQPVVLWSVRRALRGLNLDASSGAHRSSARARGSDSAPEVVTLLLLDSDPHGQSIGPLLAATAASLERQTALLGIGDPGSASSLRAGMAVFRRQRGTRKNLTVLRSLDEAAPGTLVLALTVVDPRRDPPDLPRESAATLLCIGPGAATVDDLSRLALSLDEAGREISGVVIADPQNWTPSYSVGGVMVRADGVPEPESVEAQQGLDTEMAGGSRL